MKTSSWRQWWKSVLRVRPMRPISRAGTRRRTLLRLEQLEERTLLSGTPQMVLDINTATQSSNPAGLVAIGSTVYFGATDGTSGTELWKSDGTSAGTVMVADLKPGPASSSEPRYLTNVNGELFFVASGSSSGGLWKSDGTSAGTTLVQSFPLGTGAEADLLDLTNVNGTLFFAANDGTHGRELWESNGTSAGTFLVKDINLGSTGSYPAFLTNVNGELFFEASDSTHGSQLWKSNGTSAGTVMVKNINGDINGTVGSSPADLTNVNGTLFFSANDGSHGYQLWKSDGTSAGTALVKDIYTFSGLDHGSYPKNLTNVSGTLFFAAFGPYGDQLWKSNGTTSGTVEVSYGIPQYAAPYDTGFYPPSNFTNVNGRLFFSAYDGSHGQELWESDGTSAGTFLVKDINPGSGGSNPSSLTNVNGELFFTATDGSHGDELWKSNGTSAGTTMVADFYLSSNGLHDTSYLTNRNGTLFFAANDGTHGTELWKSDGTSAGTVLIADGNPGCIGSYPKYLTNINGMLFFSALDQTHGRELWQSDGTSAGTALVADILPGSLSSYPSSLTNANGTLFFAATDGVHGDELWMLASATAPAAGSLSVSGFPSTIQAGSSGSFKVTALNPDGSIDTSYTSTVVFTSSDTRAALPATYTFTAADAGSHTFTATLFTAGTQSITATDTTTTGFTGSDGGIIVLPAGASQLTFAQQPSTTTAGQAISPAVTVDVEDQYGNLVSGDSSTVTVTLNGGTFAGGSATAAAAVSGGVATFSNLTIDKVGSYTLTATDGSLTPANSVSFTVNPAAASQLGVSGFPSPTTAGAAHTFVVTALDPYGNTATGYIGTVHFTSSDAKAALPTNYTFTAADAGTHTFSAALKTAGTQSITATDTTTASIKGTEGGITVQPAAASKFVLTGPSSVTHGVPFSLTLTVEDAYGNVVTGYLGTVHFSSTDTTASLPANYTFTAGDAGVHTFTGLVLHKKGKQKITVTDTQNSSLTARITEQVT